MAAWSLLSEGVVSDSEDSSNGNAIEKGRAELASTGTSLDKLSCSLALPGAAYALDLAQQTAALVQKETVVHLCRLLSRRAQR